MINVSSVQGELYYTKKVKLDNTMESFIMMHVELYYTHYCSYRELKKKNFTYGFCG